MSELHLDLEQGHETEYGTRYEGVVATEDHDIPIVWREPPEHEQNGNIYVMANGWLGAGHSMRLPAHEAAHAGNIAVTFGYTNTGSTEALKENANDMAAIIDAVPEGLNRQAMGLSMGGYVTAMALERAESWVQSATLISSAGFIQRDPTKREVLMHFAAEGIELAEHAIEDPFNVGRLGVSTIKNIVRRRQAVRAEIYELTHGSAHDSIISVKSNPDAPFIRFVYGDKDRLIPADAQEDGIKGMPFDDVLKYRGGHLGPIFRPAVSRRLFELDAELPSLETIAA